MTSVPPQFHVRAVPRRDGLREYGVQFGDFPVPWSGLARALTQDPEASRALTRVIVDAPFAACFWETTPVRPRAAATPVRFVVLDAPTLVRMPEDPRPFADHLRAGAGRPEARAFDSLGRDARLVAPTHGGGYPHAHLAAFLRAAPPEHAAAWWSALGREVEVWLTTRAEPLWVSTSGLGVAWLHGRLDTRPKYYQHAPYRSAP